MKTFVKTARTLSFSGAAALSLMAVLLQAKLLTTFVFPYSSILALSEASRDNLQVRLPNSYRNVSQNQIQN